jgi:SAM-dependent methyltransferase
MAPCECLETGFVFLENPPATRNKGRTSRGKKTQHRNRSDARATNDLSAASEIIGKARRPTAGAEGSNAKRFGSRELQSATPPLRVLDVGCASGQKALRIAAKMRGEHGVAVEPIGIEVSDVLAHHAQRNLAEYGGYAIHAPAIEGLQRIEDGSIDLIILSSYLEHEVLPLEALRGCAAKLAPAGRIIIKVPNFASLNRRVRGSRWCGFRYPDHVNYFTPATLKLSVKRAGLAVVRMNLLDRLPTNDNMWLIAGHRCR